MTARGERCLFQHLTDRESLETIAREGLDPELLPSEALRPIFESAVDYYFSAGRAKAPSVAALRAEDRWANALDDAEVDLEVEPEDSVEWAIEDLKATWVYRETQRLNKAFATAMAEADIADRVEVASAYATELVGLSMRLERRDASVDLREGMGDRLLAYEERERNRSNVYGMTLGDPILDAYTRGIHPGELAILGGPPKSGKSYMADRIALREWQAGSTCVLYTLENSVDMTLDRIGCMAQGVNAREWMHGTASASDVERVRTWVNELPASPNPLWVLQPPSGSRSIGAMVRKAQVLGCDSLILDQLSFVELEGDPRAPKTQRIGETLQLLKSMISTGRHRIPALVNVQISREGVKSARKLGHLDMEHFADSAEIERTADWAFGLYQTVDQQATMQAMWQTLAARRDELRHFALAWQINTGFMQTLHPITTLESQ